MNTTYIIDFDSTLIDCESMDVLAEIALDYHPDKDYRIQQIDALTKQGMSGELAFAESLSQRVVLLSASRDHITQTIEQLIDRCTRSFLSLPVEVRLQCVIISGGFHDIIDPIAEHLGVSQVFANRFLFDDQGWVIGVDQTNLLAQNQGKVQIIKKNFSGREKKIMIGDGYTDYETKLCGVVDEFRYYGEHVQRANIIDKSDKILYSFDDIFLGTS